jgi:SAM-dependent methyltransferase
MPPPIRPNPYDEVSYASRPHPESHPDRLRLIAHLFRLAPAPAERCRVLEIGCSSGGNLIPMAEALPESEFFGIDLSESAVAAGQEAVRMLALPNLELGVVDLAAIPADAGLFDYIIAHGVYSWVPAAARAALLDVLARHLAPDGVAYISHNVKPGFHARESAREIMRFHAGGVADPTARGAQARAVLGFIAKGALGASWSDTLRREFETVIHQPDWLLYHDGLAEVNDACWFHEIAAALDRRGLQFLADAQLGSMVPIRFGAEVQEMLDRIAPDELRRQQYLDFLDNRAFRRTLAVRADRRIVRSLGPPQARDLHFATTASEGPEGKFTTSTGGEVTVGRVETQNALRALAARAPASLPWSALAANAAGRGDEIADELASDLMQLSLEGFVDIALTPARCAPAAGPRPRAPAHVRLAARAGENVTSLRHTIVKLTPESRAVVMHADGTASREELGQRAGLSDAVTVEAALASLATNGLLVC